MDTWARSEGWGDLTPAQRGLVPTFFVIGAMKAGTTSLWRLLGHHPEVFMSPVKEPGYFAASAGALDGILPGRASTSVRQLEDYLALFSGVSDERAIGEASPVYLYLPWALERIRAVVERPRLVAILRNPADRAFSHYVWARATGDHRAPTFADAVSAELEGPGAGGLAAGGLGIVGPGFYGRHVAALLERFDPSQLHVVLQEDLAADPVATLGSIFTFLDVDPTAAVGDRTRFNERRPVVRSRALARFTAGRSRAGRGMRRLVPAPVARRLAAGLDRWNEVVLEHPAEVRRRLLELYEPDIALLGRLTGRDLSVWSA